MDGFDALVTAGGKGSRLQSMGREKPMIPIRGRPMIRWVIDALADCERVERTVISVSRHTPLTRTVLGGEGFEIVQTSGNGYVSDLREAMSHLRGRGVLVIPADLPMIRTELVDMVLEEYLARGRDSLAVVVPVDLLQALGFHFRYDFSLGGRRVVNCGVSVVNREALVSGAPLDEDHLESSDIAFALNVNGPGELAMVERLL
ncbi:MAG: NTP transferase domain-containing protein [Methanomassiliicoccales archaeon]